MKKLLFLVTLFLLIGCNQNGLDYTPTFNSNSSKKEAILKLDTGGHTALINDIIVTKEGDIISASEDKTIRVWDSVTGKEKRKILGQIGAGSEGKIYAIALSPNEEFLAVGGFLANPKNLSEACAIRIYNYKIGKLLKVLKSHRNVVYDLAFSPDGKYLISGSGDNTAKIWSVNDWNLKDTIKFHTNDVYAVKIIKKEGNYFAVTEGDDNRIALYDMQKHKIIKSDKKNYNLDYLAISHNHIAVCGSGKEIQIYNHNLEPINTIVSETKPKGLAYSPNGKYLIAGSRSSFSYELINIYSVEENYKKISSFKKHKNLTQAVAFLDNQTAISGGGDNNEIYIWDIKTANDLKKIEGVGDTVWSVGLKGDTVAWGNKLKAVSVNNRGELQKSINLKTFQIMELGLQSKYNRISTTYKNYSLNHRKGGDYGYADGVLDIKRDGKTIASIIRGSTNGYRHRCYGFYKNYIVSGGNNGQLKIYNLKGREIANLVGHTGEVWSIALDGDRLVSGSADQTIRVWNLSFLGAGTLVPDNTMTKVIAPMLNLFISKDNEWIAWTPSVYYNSSIEGAKYVGFHINQGSNHEAYYVSAYKYPDLYRPDIVEAVLKTGSEKRAIELVSKHRKVKAVDIVSEMPPIIY